MDNLEQTTPDFRPLEESDPMITLYEVPSFGTCIPQLRWLATCYHLEGIRPSWGRTKEAATNNIRRKLGLPLIPEPVIVKVEPPPVVVVQPVEESKAAIEVEAVVIAEPSEVPPQESLAVESLPVPEVVSTPTNEEPSFTVEPQGATPLEPAPEVPVSTSSVVDEEETARYLAELFPDLA